MLLNKRLRHQATPTHRRKPVRHTNFVITTTSIHLGSEKKVTGTCKRRKNGVFGRIKQITKYEMAPGLDFPFYNYSKCS